MILNGVEYKNVQLDFNAVCELEEMGVDISNIGGKIMCVARAYAALCMRKPASVAGKAIEEHVLSGGSLNDIYESFASELEKSGFFLKMREESEKATLSINENGETEEA